MGHHSVSGFPLLTLDPIVLICGVSATAFASFLILGFLEIGREIENPFSYELNVRASIRPIWPYSDGVTSTGLGS